jgi:acyl-CoA reductase-like NAD-dependent aldehyde dehydrogenase
VERDQVESIVEKVLERIKKGEAPGPAPSAGKGGHGVFKTVADAHAAAKSAQQTLIALPLEKRREIIANIRKRTAEDVHNLAKLAVDETGLGRVEDKIKKNLLVIFKTPGPEILEPIAYTGDDGLTLIERAPYGVIAAITPSTNPTETILCNGIGMVSAGNAVVFNPHPGAKGCSAYVIDLVNKASMEVGGPDNVMTVVGEPTIESANELLRAKGIRLNVVTGGPAVVKAAFAANKKCICGGPGNPPVVVDETADLDQAGRGIVMGGSFDNNVICTDEKEVLVAEKVGDALVERMVGAGAVLLRNHQVTRLEKLILNAERDHTLTKWVGKDARRYLDEIDVPYRGDPRMIVCEVPFDHPFVQLELLMPIMAVVRVKDAHEGIDLAVQAEHGFGHTASMYSKNIDHLHRMAKVANCSIFVKNAPNYAGLGFGGEGYTSFTIASPTGEGLTTAKNFSRERRCTLAGYFRIV